NEMSSRVTNVFVENCQIARPHLDSDVRINNNSMRGGLLENIFIRNIDVGEVAMAGVSIDFYYEEGEAGKFTPVTRNVDVRGLKTQKAQYALYLRGFKNAPIEGIRLGDCDFKGVA